MGFSKGAYESSIAFGRLPSSPRDALELGKNFEAWGLSG